MSKHKQYFYLIVSIYLTNCYFTAAKDLPYASVEDNNKLKSVNKTEIKSTNTSIIPSEGGGKIILSTSSSSSTPTTIEKTSTKNATSTTTTTERIKPVSEAEEIVGDSKVKPRKGVTFSESTNTTSTSTTTTTTTTTSTTKKPSTASTTVKVFIPHKPTVTISNDDDLKAKKPPPKLYINGKEVLPKPKNNSEPVPPEIVPDQDEIYISRRPNKGPDYVLPIVLTILSVPLLAIIFTVLYKRGAEWWHHRHYRRMDFLIDGMYNN